MDLAAMWRRIAGRRPAGGPGHPADGPTASRLPAAAGSGSRPAAWRRLPALSPATRPPQLIGQRRPLTPGLRGTPPPRLALQPLGHDRMIDAPAGLAAGIVQPVEPVPAEHLVATVRSPLEAAARPQARPVRLVSPERTRDSEASPTGTGPAQVQRAGPSESEPGEGGGLDRAREPSVMPGAPRPVPDAVLTTSPPVAQTAGFVALPGGPSLAGGRWEGARAQLGPEHRPKDPTAAAPGSPRSTAPGAVTPAPVAGRLEASVQPASDHAAGPRNLGQSRRLRVGQALGSATGDHGTLTAARIRVGDGGPDSAGQGQPRSVGKPAPTGTGPDAGPGPGGRRASAAPPGPEPATASRSVEPVTPAVVARELAAERPPMAPLVGSLRAGLASTTPGPSLPDDGGDAEQVSRLAIVAPRFELAGVSQDDDSAAAHELPTPAPAGAALGSPPSGASSQDVGRLGREGGGRKPSTASGDPVAARQWARSTTASAAGAGSGATAGQPGHVDAPLGRAHPPTAAAAAHPPTRAPSESSAAMGPPIRLQRLAGPAATAATRSAVGRAASPTGSVPRSVGDGVGVRSRISGAAEAETWADAEPRGSIGGPAIPVQRAAGDAAQAAVDSVPSGGDEDLGWLGGPAPSAGGPASFAQRADEAAATASPGAGGGSPSDQDLDVLAGRLYERIRRRFRSELIVDRERSGALVELGR